MTRTWKDTWQNLSFWATHAPEYPLNDDLLKEIILKLYYNNYKNLIVKKESYESEFDRKLIKTLLHGDYHPYGVSYSVQGSPPKGTILVFDPQSKKDIYLYNNGKMQKLMSQKYGWVRNLFFEDAVNVLNKNMKTKISQEE